MVGPQIWCLAYSRLKHPLVYNLRVTLLKGFWPDWDKQRLWLGTFCGILDSVGFVLYLDVVGVGLSCGLKAREALDWWPVVLVLPWISVWSIPFSYLNKLHLRIWSICSLTSSLPQSSLLSYERALLPDISKWPALFQGFGCYLLLVTWIITFATVLQDFIVSTTTSLWIPVTSYNSDVSAARQFIAISKFKRYGTCLVDTFTASYES